MNTQRRYLQWLRHRLPVFILIFFLAQPVLDVVGYWQAELGLNNSVTFSLRMLLMAGILFLGFVLSRRKWIYYLGAALFLCYITGHFLACIGADQGYLNWSEDLVDQIRTLVLPATALSLMSCLAADRRVLPAMLRAMVINLGIILFVQLISRLTGTDPYTYPSKGVGVRGWFIWTSPQSAILSLLCPLVIAYVSERWSGRIIPFCICCLVSFGMLFFYGTRLAYFTVAGVGLGMFLVFLLDRRRRVQAAGVLLSAVLVLAFYPISPMAVNRAAVAQNETVKQQRVDAAVQEVQRGKSEEQTTPDLKTIAAAYRYNLQGMIDRFGLERVAERYGYTLDAGVICNDRTMKARFCEMLRQDISKQSPLSALFGVELSRTRVSETEVYDFYADDWNLDTENYDPENDVLGVLTLNGVLGVGFLALFLLFFGLRALWAVWKDHSRITPLFFAFLAAYGIGLIYAVSTASTLRRNNASVYFACALAGLWYLSACPKPEGVIHDAN